MHLPPRQKIDLTVAKFVPNVAKISKTDHISFAYGVSSIDN